MKILTLIIHFFLCSLICHSQTNSSRKTIDIKLLKSMDYMVLAPKVNCDSMGGSTLERRVCANLELQLQDSILKQILAAKIVALKNEGLDLKGGNKTLIKAFVSGQKIWEEYRYTHCSSCIRGKSQFDMILFLECATHLTIERQKLLLKECVYNFDEEKEEPEETPE